MWQACAILTLAICWSNDHFYKEVQYKAGVLQFFECQMPIHHYAIGYALSGTSTLRICNDLCHNELTAQITVLPY